MVSTKGAFSGVNPASSQTPSTTVRVVAGPGPGRDRLPGVGSRKATVVHPQFCCNMDMQPSHLTSELLKVQHPCTDINDVRWDMAFFI